MTSCKRNRVYRIPEDGRSPAGQAEVLPRERKVEIMSDEYRRITDPSRTSEAIELTKFLVHKHYCENDFLADETLFDDPFLWFGAADQEFATGRETVLDIFRQFQGKVPKCNITGEEYRAEMVAPDVCLVAGRMWITTDPSTRIYIQVHQRISTCIRWTGEKARCCLIHISNPYSEMEQDDVGFPEKMAKQSREYMQQQLEEQKKLTQSAVSELASIYHTVPCGIVRLLRKNGSYELLTFNRTLADQLGVAEKDIPKLDWSQGFSQQVVAEDAGILSNALDQLTQPGCSTNVDYRLVSKNGKIIYLNSSNDLISEDENGQIIQRLTYDISPRIELENALKRLSFVDLLSGIFNRNRFNVDVGSIQNRSISRLGVACFDLNGLKEWNDKMGHPAGDELIRKTALHIASVFPDKTYRIGGDEFVVLDDEKSEESFRASVARVLARMEENHIGISAGLSWRSEGCNVWTQYEEADRLMYREKQAFYQKTGKSPHREYGTQSKPDLSK